MNLPRILIIGRPNVGKSTLINRICKQNKAITLDEPGVTRDVVSYPVTWKKKPFYLLDSAGIGISQTSNDVLQSQIEAQIEAAIQSADHVIFLVDVLAGVMSGDEEIAHKLREQKDKVTLVVNKVDNEERAFSVSEFYSLGFSTVFPISAIQGTGIDLLFETIFSQIKPSKKDKTSEKTPVKVGFIGRPNVGKSSLLNAITRSEYAIVSDVPGTTRDSLSAHWTVGDTDYELVDTAGLRKRSKVEDGVEYYSTVRTQRVIEESDVVIVVIEPEMLLCDQDKKIISLVLKSQKSMILLVNKWDLTPKTDLARQDLLRIIESELPMLKHYPVHFCSAKMGLKLGPIFNLIASVMSARDYRISTPELNTFFQTTVNRFPPASTGKKVKIYYGTHVKTRPHEIVVFSNQLKGMSQDYQRFLEKQFRMAYPQFLGHPVQFFFRAHRAKSEPKT